ncbi:FAD-dependent oxidoreductase [Pelomonas sp. KK5]|uniref:FAD-dependent oxidoreductase n=1 Tax=Pelomonas sp. KK5 TaxID=1855730 RepID=UPI00117D4D1B|nr:FAD-dependent oxidoreductase [Pelomonas sp. KK5]
MQRRQLLASVPALLTGTTALAQDEAAVRFGDPRRTLAPVRANPDRLIDMEVCTRPFRAQGPRIEAQRLHGKHVVHHYGHGGSGWSLSWGSARVALPLILEHKPKRIAVIGCGAIGLTTARVAQDAGLKVRIYCKERPPEVASSRATGIFTPDSRLVTTEHATPEFAHRWEAMTRSSFRTYQSLLGLPAEPVQWRDGYVLWDDVPQGPSHEPGEPDYPDLYSRIRDLRPRSMPLQPHEHPFKAAHAMKITQLVFNIGSYQRLLLDDFLRNGGEIVHREFTSTRELARLPEQTIVNCTGYGARALFGDDSLVPVRGQTARLIPQPEVDYLLFWRGHNLSMVPRGDGLLVQAQGEHDFGNADARVDRAQSVAAVERLAELFS